MIAFKKNNKSCFPLVDLPGGGKTKQKQNNKTAVLHYTSHVSPSRTASSIYVVRCVFRHFVSVNHAQQSILKIMSYSNRKQKLIS